MELHPELDKAIRRNLKWIKRKCRLREENPEIRKELLNEVYYNLILSNKNFSQKDEVNADAWVKKVTTNTTADHVHKEVKYNSPLSEERNEIEMALENASGDSSTSVPLEIQEIFVYVNEIFSPKDREIISLHIMHESNAVIAEIMGLDERTIINKISLLKNELKEYLKKRDQDE